MRTSRSIPTALLACALMTGACATSRPPSASPPTVDPPSLSSEPCRLPRLPVEGPVTWADLERVYLERGEAILACDLARRLSVQAHAAERAAVELWLSENQRPRWNIP